MTEHTDPDTIQHEKRRNNSIRRHVVSLWAIQCCQRYVKNHPQMHNLTEK
jgi:hypothetical protein